MAHGDLFGNVRITRPGERVTSGAETRRRRPTGLYGLLAAARAVSPSRGGCYGFGAGGFWPLCSTFCSVVTVVWPSGVSTVSVVVRLASLLQPRLSGKAISIAMAKVFMSFITVLPSYMLGIKITATSSRPDYR